MMIVHNIPIGRLNQHYTNATGLDREQKTVEETKGE